MSKLTFPITADGLRVPVMIGVCASTAVGQKSSGQTVTRPILALGEIDTGANHCSVAPWILNQLRIPSHGFTGVTMAGGPGTVRLYDVSLSIVGPGGSVNPMFVVPQVEVSDLQSILPIDALIGLDVLLQCQLFLDGPARQFTLTF